MSPIEVGELLCDTLAYAEDAAALSFALLQNETVTAEKSYYAVTNGEVFTDGIGRKVCFTGFCAYTRSEGLPCVIFLAANSTILHTRRKIPSIHKRNRGTYPGCTLTTANLDQLLLIVGSDSRFEDPLFDIIFFRYEACVGTTVPLSFHYRL